MRKPHLSSCIFVLGATLLTAGAAGQATLGEVNPNGPPIADCGELEDVESDHSPGVFGPQQTCTPRIVVDCAQTAPAPIEIRFSDNPGTHGTVVFFSATVGGAYWARELDHTIPETSTEELQLQLDLTTGANDYKVVEVKYLDGWPVASSGMARAACRPATVLKWILDQSQLHVNGTPACATGQSGGGNQLAYSMTHYEAEAKLNGAIFTSGPLYSDMPLACGESCDGNNTYPDSSLGCFKASSRWGIDLAYGEDPSGNILMCQFQDPAQHESCGEANFFGPCMQHSNGGDPATLTAFERDSVAVDLQRWDYDYGSLGLSFINGSGDGGPAPAQQLIFAQAVQHNSNVQAPLTVDAPHRLTDDRDGRRAILQDLASFCQVIDPFAP